MYVIGNFVFKTLRTKISHVLFPMGRYQTPRLDNICITSYVCWISRCHKNISKFYSQRVQARCNKSSGKNRYWLMAEIAILFLISGLRSGFLSSSTAHEWKHVDHGISDSQFHRNHVKRTRLNQRMRVADERRLVDDTTRHAVGWHYDTHAAGRRCFQTQTKRVGGRIARFATRPRQRNLTILSNWLIPTETERKVSP